MQPEVSSAGPETFVPDRIFLRGWAPYRRDLPDKGRSLGFSKPLCDTFWKAIESKLAGHFQSRILRASYPFAKNSQITVTVKPGLSNDELWNLREALDNILKSRRDWPGIPADKSLFATVDRPQWQKDRFASTKTAEECLNSSGLPEGVSLVIDSNAGEIWGERGDQSVLFGRWLRPQAAWAWIDSELVKLGLSSVDIRSSHARMLEEF